MTRKQAAAALAIFIALLILLLTAEKLANNSSPPSADILHLRLVTARSESYPATRGAAQFAKLVAERSGGEIKIDIFAGTQAESDEQAIAEQVSFGAIDMACISTAPLISHAPSLKLLELPMLFESREHLYSVLDSEVGKSMLASLSESQMVGLAFYDDGEKLLFNSLHSIHRPFDMQELRLCCRQSEESTTIARLWGAQASSMALGDIYRSLQTGRANGADDNVVSYVRNRYYLEAPFLTTTPITAAPAVLVCSKMVFDTLTDEQQQILLEAAADTVVYQREHYLEAEQSAWEFLESSSVIKNAIMDRTLFRALSQPLYDECRLNWPIKLNSIEEMKYPER